MILINWISNYKLIGWSLVKIRVKGRREFRENKDKKSLRYGNGRLVWGLIKDMWVIVDFKVNMMYLCSRIIIYYNVS